MLLRRDGGVSLVELILAMLLLALGLLALAAALPTAMVAIHASGAQTVAVQAALGQVATARTTAYERLPDLDTGGFVPAGDPPGLLRAITVKVGVPTVGTTTVSVGVRWAGSASPGDTVTLETVVSP
jgi:type II secretory pathway pseudopilin PulG